jgi:hypothetical protein
MLEKYWFKDTIIIQKNILIKNPLKSAEKQIITT